MMRKYIAAPLALYVGTVAERSAEGAGVPFWPAFLAGLAVIVAVLFLVSGRRAAS